MGLNLVAVGSPSTKRGIVRKNGIGKRGATRTDIAALLKCFALRRELFNARSGDTSSIVLRYETKVGKACEKSDMISDFQSVPFALKAATVMHK